MPLVHSAAADVGADCRARRSASGRRRTKKPLARLADDEFQSLRQYADIADDETERKHWVDSPTFNLVVGILIVINAIFVGLETQLGPVTSVVSERVVWYVMENFFCAIFLIEMIVKIIHLGFYYFRQWSNVLDFFLVVMAILDTWVLTLIAGNSAQMKTFAVLRIARMLRLVRLARLLRMFRELWLIVQGLMESLKTLIWVAVLLLIVLYVTAIFITIIVGKSDEFDDDPNFDNKDLFGSVPASMYTLFQVITLESWSQAVARPIMKKKPWLVLFFIVFLTLTTFGLLNIVVGIIVENTLAASKNNEEKKRQRQQRENLRVLIYLKRLFHLSDTDGSGTVTLQEFREAITKPGVEELLDEIDLPVPEAEELFLILDDDDSGELSVDEFLRGCARLKNCATSKDMVALQMTVLSLQKRVTQAENASGMRTQRLEKLGARLRGLAPNGPFAQSAVFRRDCLERLKDWSTDPPC